jgi:hypothetical protein
VVVLLIKTQPAIESIWGSGRIGAESPAIASWVCLWQSPTLESVTGFHENSFQDSIGFTTTGNEMTRGWRTSSFNRGFPCFHLKALCVVANDSVGCFATITAKRHETEVV